EETLTIAAADGPGAAAVGGNVPLAGSPTARVLAARQPLLDDDTLVVLLVSGATAIGSLSVNAEPGGRRFTDGDRELLELFARQAAVTIDYTRVREQLQRVALLEDRERIGRELHDGAIQALFAEGMSLQGLASMTTDPVLRERLQATVRRLDEVIRDL